MSNYATGGGQPAGWYYAEGDPPGTHRYWDGIQWQGAPQVVGYSGSSSAISAGASLAEPGQRFIAFLIDFGLLAILYFLLLVSGAFVSGLNNGVQSLVSWVFWLLHMGFGIFNWTYLQGTTGQTIGKKQQNISLYKADTLQPVGIGMAFVRTFFHWVLWLLCFLPLIIDHIMVLVSGDHRRFSDSLMGMHVYKSQ